MTLAKVDPSDRIIESVMETARDLYAEGLITEQRMGEYEAMLQEVKSAFEYSSEQIRALRERWELSQAELAGKLNVSPATIRRWEVGKTRPQGPVLVLLDLMDRKGVEVLAR
jgi:putative transcriptional regulator